MYILESFMASWVEGGEEEEGEEEGGREREETFTKFGVWERGRE